MQLHTASIFCIAFLIYTKLHENCRDNPPEQNSDLGMKAIRTQIYTYIIICQRTRSIHDAAFIKHHSL